MAKIYDENVYKHSDNICLKCEYDMCEDCKLFNNTDYKESDIEDGESD